MIGRCEDSDAICQYRLGAWYCPVHKGYECTIELSEPMGNRNALREHALASGRSTEQIAPPVPTPETDAAPPGDTSTHIVFLAGAIKYWWLYKCPKCGSLYEHDRSCCGRWTMPLWDSPEHQAYLAWRRDLRAAMIEAGHLTYAPHEAFKGRWDERAQAVNDAGIAAADVMVVMSDRNWLSEGTDAEIHYAELVGTKVIFCPPPSVPNGYGLGTAVAFINAVLKHLDAAAGRR